MNEVSIKAHTAYCVWLGVGILYYKGQWQSTVCAVLLGLTMVAWSLLSLLGGHGA